MTLTRSALPVGFLVIAMSIVALCGVDIGLRGSVRDQQGNVIAGAEVVLSANGRELRTQTGPDGSFAFPQVAAIRARIRTRVGLSSAETSVDLATTREIGLVVAISSRRETINVTATRFPLPSDSTPEVRRLPEAAIVHNPALSLDEILRDIPSFTLFRRTPGWSANPTSQGVSLRGLGASGASRALVLADGVPLNDPFGGWVYWNQVPRTELEAIEVAAGPESDVYGTDALGGAIQLLRRPVQDRYAVMDTSFANLVTPNGSASGGVRIGDWTMQAAAQGFRTNGYVPVLPLDRGAVDSVVQSEFAGGEAAVERMVGQRGRVFLRGGYYAEARQNGTLLQTNNANLRDLSIGSDWATGTNSRLTVRVFGGDENLGQSFTAVSSDRNSETLTRLQSVPAHQFGSSVEWSGTVGGQTLFVSGDGRRIVGESDEIACALGIPSASLANGGSQNLYGITGQAYLHPHPRVLVSVGARVDHWTNADGFSSSAPFSAGSTPTVNRFADRNETAFSPKVGLQLRISDRVRFFGSASRAFRAPTLNELYRSFRVGNVLTLANKDLRAEELTGYETGIRVRAGEHATLQGSWFWNRIDRPVANVTQAVTPALITRQRENLGQTRSRGVDTLFNWSPRAFVGLTAAYVYTRATVTDFPGSPNLIGAWVPQVPRHTATAQVHFSRPRMGVIALQARYQGKQFDDDQNLLPLAGFFTLDAYASHAVGRGVEIYVGAENMLDRRYQVGRTPVLTIGPPAMAKVGLRWSFGETLPTQ